MTDHQLAVASFLISLLAALVPLYLWLNRKLDLASKRQMRRDLQKIAELGEQRYAERQLQRVRFCLGIGAYVFCCGGAIPHTHISILDTIFPFAAAIFFLMAGALSQVTTVYGVKERVIRHRKRLGLSDEPQQSPPV